MSKKSAKINKGAIISNFIEMLHQALFVTDFELGGDCKNTKVFKGTGDAFKYKVNLQGIDFLVTFEEIK